MLSGCAGPQKINAWPTYYRESDEAGRTTHAEVLWPFGELDRSPEFEQWAIRPLVNHRVEHADDTTEWQALFPLVRFRKSAKTGRRSD
jgi:hypothetical protein